MSCCPQTAAILPPAALELVKAILSTPQCFPGVLALGEDSDLPGLDVRLLDRLGQDEEIEGCLGWSLDDDRPAEGQLVRSQS